MAASRPVIYPRGLSTLRNVLRVTGRYLFPLIALALIADWLLAPRKLTIESALLWQASAKIWADPAVRYQRSKFKHAHIVGSQGQEAKIDCTTIEGLCDGLKQRQLDALTVWVVEPGFFYGTWLVAAQHENRMLLSPETQNRAYAGARMLSAIVTLVVIAIALFAWRGPLAKLLTTPAAEPRVSNSRKR